MSDSAKSNAAGWAASIAEAFEAYKVLDGGEAETVQLDGEQYGDCEAVREHCEEMPLSVQVRDGWRSPGAKSDGAEEFEILLSTGGPALRIYGQIGGRWALQYQDWGTPWTDYYGTSHDEDEALGWFVGLFGIDDY